jgi:hypothetical protein
MTYETHLTEWTRPEGVHKEIDDDVVRTLDPELLQQVQVGERTLHPGRDAYKPVIRYGPKGQHPGALAPGSGVSPRHQDVENGRRGAIKQTKEYGALLERIIPANEDTEQWGSFGWLVTQGLRAAEGNRQKKDVTCSECGHIEAVEFAGKPDTNAIIKLIEFLRGRATETREIDVRAAHIHKTLEAGVDISELLVNALPPDEVAARRKALEASRARELAGDIAVQATEVTHD